MIKLIYADKLKEAIEKHKGTQNSTDVFKYCFDCGINESLSEIESAENVDAVPMSWLEERSKLVQHFINSSDYNY